MRLFWSLVLSSTLASPAVFAMGSKPEPTEPSSPPSTSSGMPSDESGPRLEAERSYADGYDQVTKAKKDLEAGKGKNAEKKFKKALERVEHATELDPNYHEAWNMVGYCSRKLGDYPKAFSAYQKALSIKPDYAPAHEYLGEAYLEQNDPGKAREQLAMLEQLNASEETTALRTAIDAYDKAHPDTKAAPAQTPPNNSAAPDTATKSGL
jgi:tetratricopeptide (TPR) repeat protein